MKKLFVVFLIILGSICLVGAQIKPSANLEIKGAKVPTLTDAKMIAFTSYVKKMRLEVLSTEGIHAENISIIILGYDIKDFASKGESIWEARVTTIKGELRAILWVSAKTGEVYYVIGPWINRQEKEQKEHSEKE